MAKTETTTSEQLRVAEFNLKAMYGELERTRLLLEIAETADKFVDHLVARRVRDGALEALDRQLHPVAQMIPSEDQ